MRTPKHIAKELIARAIMELLRAFAYCALIVFLLNTIFDVKLNEAIAIGPISILWTGAAAFFCSTGIKLYLLRNANQNV